MSRGNTSAARCLTVWLAATAALGAAGLLAAGTAASLVRSATWEHSFEDLLVAVCAGVLLACGVRLWLVTTLTTVDLVRGRVPRPARGVIGRLVLAACGAAVVAGIAAPATAGQGSDLQRLAGLPLPDRASAGAAAHPGTAPVAGRPAPPATRLRPAVVHRTPPPAGDEVVVRSGDSLWSISAALLPRSAGSSQIDDAWRAVYAANRGEIGSDPGLIRPGQRLRLPLAGLPHTDADGADR